MDEQYLPCGKEVEMSRAHPSGHLPEDPHLLHLFQDSIAFAVSDGVRVVIIDRVKASTSYPDIACGHPVSGPIGGLSE